MTHPNDIFDALESADEETAAWLDRHFGLSAHDADRITDGEREAIRARVLGSSARSPRASGIVAGPWAAFPAGVGWRVQRVASLAAAAVLILLVAATLGAYLRSDRGEQLPGAAATASVLPFAPGAALASPAAATCATDATLVLNLDPAAVTGALTSLPFPVAFQRDGDLVVQRGGEVLREIEIGEGYILRTTAVPGVILASSFEPGKGYVRYTFINIVTGEKLDLGAVLEMPIQSDQYVFWTSDGSYTHWNVTDLRSFETADLGESFGIEPLAPWRPYVEAVATAVNGTVMLVGTTSYQPVNKTVPPATPFPADLPALTISQDAILIDGSVDDIRLIGPRSVSSGAMALSPDGSMVAWLGHNDRPGTRYLTIREVATGEEVTGRPIDATYSNSLLFSVDGEFLYATYGTTLERIDLDLANGFSGGVGQIELPDTGYQIVGASPDRTKVLLDRGGSAPEDTSLWVNLDTGEVRELPGQPSSLFTAGIPGISGLVSHYVSLNYPGSSSDDREMRVVDMTTGEVIISETRSDVPLVSISDDGSTLLIPDEDAVELWRPAAGEPVAFAAPEGVESVSTTFALSPDGACAAGTWDLEGDAIETVLLPLAGGDPVELPDSGVGGWVVTGRS